jgi:hypothetical protein
VRLKREPAAALGLARHQLQVPTSDSMGTDSLVDGRHVHRVLAVALTGRIVIITVTRRSHSNTTSQPFPIVLTYPLPSHKVPSGR